jgi:hypothetical protein
VTTQALLSGCALSTQSGRSRTQHRLDRCTDQPDAYRIGSLALPHNAPDSRPQHVSSRRCGMGSVRLRNVQLCIGPGHERAGRSRRLYRDATIADYNREIERHNAHPRKVRQLRAEGRRLMQRQAPRVPTDGTRPPVTPRARSRRPQIALEARQASNSTGTVVDAHQRPRTQARRGNSGWRTQRSRASPAASDLKK